MSNTDTEYVYRWKNNAKRATLYQRRCFVLARLPKNTAIVEFEDGQREVISRNALQVATADMGKTQHDPNTNKEENMNQEKTLQKLIDDLQAIGAVITERAPRDPMGHMAATFEKCLRKTTEDSQRAQKWLDSIHGSATLPE